MTYLYTPLLYLFLPLVLLRLALRGFRNAAYWERWGERFGYTTVRGPVDVWLHAVSVGEVRAAAPLIQTLTERSAATRIVVTTMTPSGSDQVFQLFGDGVQHCYVPYDYPSAVERFLDAVRPGLALIMETEMWPNIIRGCGRRGIPVVFANVRLSERSFRRYRRVFGMLRSLLGQVDGFAVQSRADADRLVALGARRDTVQVTGSIKFEVKLPASLTEVAQVLRREWGHDRPVWIAGSTHEGEDELILEVFGRLKNRNPKLLLVLVPRHPERFNAVARTAQRAGFRTVRRSEKLEPLAEDVDVYIGDTMGELTLLYAAADIAFVGGSLVPTGGHNILEPCALGIPVLFGPHMFNFAEISQLALEREAGAMVRDGEELEKAVETYLSDPNLRFKTGESGRALIEENRGALERTQKMLAPFLGGVAGGG